MMFLLVSANCLPQNGGSRLWKFARKGVGLFACGLVMRAGGRVDFIKPQSMRRLDVGNRREYGDSNQTENGGACAGRLRCKTSSANETVSGGPV